MVPRGTCHIGNSTFIQTSLIFPVSFLCVRIPFPVYSTPSHLISLVSCGLWELLRLDLNTWTALRNTGQVFGRMSLRLGLSGVFLMFDWGDKFLRGWPQRWSAVFIPQQGYVLSTWLTCNARNLDHRADSTHQVSLELLFPHSCFPHSFCKWGNRLEVK